MFVEAALCLAMNIYQEARGETLDGQIAVANVTLNRVDSPRFPDTVCGVVYQPSQFSWTRGNPLPVPTNQQAWTQALVISTTMLNGRPKDITYGATYYFAPARLTARPHWASSFTLTTTIGGHEFLK